MKKIINSENVQYQPVLTEELVLDDKATVGSFNGITSDAVARAVAGASGEVPEVTSSDNGKVLTAIYDEGGPAVEWAEAPSELPDTTGASQGDVLSIGSSGLEWAPPSGGGGGSSRSQFDTTFNLTYDSAGTWKLSTASSYRLDLTGGAGVYAYKVTAEVTDSSAATEIDGLYAVTVCVGNFNSQSETQLIRLLSDPSGYPDDPTSMAFKASGVLDISLVQGLKGQNVYVMIKPATAGGTPITTFTGGTMTLTLAKLSTLTGGWQPQE